MTKTTRLQIAESFHGLAFELSVIAMLQIALVSPASCAAHYLFS